MSNYFNLFKMYYELKIIYCFRRKNLKFGIGSACIGGGQGIALLVENV